MADRLVAIRKLLTHERQDRRCAAAIVLAELHVNDPRSIKALLQVTDDEDPLVRGYVLDALGQARALDAVNKFVEMMDDPDAHVRKAAESALVQVGEDAVPALQELLEGPTGTRRKAADLLSRLQSSAGIESLIDTVSGADTTVLDRTRKALRGRAGDMEPQELRELRKRIENRLNEARRNDDSGLAAALLQLLGDLRDDTVVTRIMQEIGADTPPAVRRVALGTMLKVLPHATGRRREAAIEKLLLCLAEDDEEGVIRPALHALKDVEIPERLTSRLQELTDAPTVTVRAYVLSQLGKLGVEESVDTLVEKLVKGSAPVRAAARDALAELPASASSLSRAFMEVSDPARQREIGELLRKHRKSLEEKEAKDLCAAVVDQIVSGDQDHRPLIETTSRALPVVFMIEVRERVVKLREQGELDKAYNLASSTRRCSAFGEEERFLLAILGLMRHPEASRPPRATDRVCVPIAELLNSGFPIESRLRDEEGVEVKDLYNLGFAFSESRDEDERDFGQDLLEEVTLRDPEGKFGSRAQNKLKLTSR